MNFLKPIVTLFHFNRTNWKAVALCFLAAAIFWLFNALNKTYSTNLRFPMQFEFDQRLFAPSRPLPQNILINVNGNGWDLFRKYFGIKVPVLTIPLGRPAETKKIIASTLPGLFTPQMGGLHINYVVIDTIRLQIEPRSTRKFKLVADPSSISFRDGLGRISPIAVEPDSALINGPSSLLTGLGDTLILRLPPKRLTDDYNEEVAIDMTGQEFVKRDPPVVQVRFEVGALVGVVRSVPLVTDKFPWGVVAGRDSVQCSFRVPQERLASFEQTDIHCVVDLSELQKGETRTYFPTIVGVPSFVEVRRVDSVRIKRY